MDDNQIEKYRNIAVNFINNNKTNLVRIYMQHFTTDGDGILLIDLFEIETKKNVDVSFVKIEILDNDLLERINERKSQNDNNIIYLLLVTPAEEKIIEIDIRTLTT
jgi:hypothetical protein